MKFSENFAIIIIESERKGTNQISWNYLFKVVWWNDSVSVYGAEEIEYRAVQAETFSEAVGVLEDFYGEDFISFEASCAEYELILLTEENFKELWREYISAGI